jgi:V8-like Glu-specific endopeptidase
MWTSLGSISSSTQTLFYYDNDMKPGQSGGPAWDYSDQTCQVCVVAVNANEFDPPTLNNGSRVNSTAYNYFLSGRNFAVKQVFLPLIVNE